jgi:hypothetical protein
LRMSGRPAEHRAPVALTRQSPPPSGRPVTQGLAPSLLSVPAAKRCFLKMRKPLVTFRVASSYRCSWSYSVNLPVLVSEKNGSFPGRHAAQHNTGIFSQPPGLQLRFASCLCKCTVAARHSSAPWQRRHRRGPAATRCGALGAAPPPQIGQ